MQAFLQLRSYLRHITHNKQLVELKYTICKTPNLNPLWKLRSLQRFRASNNFIQSFVPPLVRILAPIIRKWQKEQPTNFLKLADKRIGIQTLSKELISLSMLSLTWGHVPSHWTKTHELRNLTLYFLNIDERDRIKRLGIGPGHWLTWSTLLKRCIRNFPLWFELCCIMEVFGRPQV